MNFRFCVMVVRFFVFIFIVGVGGGMAAAQQDNGAQGQATRPPMSMVPEAGTNGASANGPTESREDFVNQLGLKMYEAAAGDLSLCAGDTTCLEDAKNIKSWICAADVCEGKDNGKKPLDCFKVFANKYAREVQAQINSSFCSLVQSPGALTRQAFLGHISGDDAKQDVLIKFGSAVMALKGSAKSCEQYIKDYVGAYGPQWEFKWYREMSGCRILAHARTREQEEKDFFTWYDGVRRGSPHCSDITNSEMRDACKTPGVTFPFHHGS